MHKHTHTHKNVPYRHRQFSLQQWNHKTVHKMKFKNLSFLIRCSVHHFFTYLFNSSNYCLPRLQQWLSCPQVIIAMPTHAVTTQSTQRMFIFCQKQYHMFTVSENYSRITNILGSNGRNNLDR